MKPVSLLPWVFGIWLAAFSLACRLAPVSANAVPAPALFRLLGGSRTAFSEGFFFKADHAFHKGVAPSARRAFHDWFTHTRDIVTPRTHAHLEGQSVQEIVPWLYLATRMNPNNVQAYAVTAFWLTAQLNRPELAERVLREAHRHNPRDYRIYLERGRLSVKTGSMDTAARVFDAGIRIWPHPLDPDDPETRMDLTRMLMFRGLLYEAQGAVERAQQFYAAILEMFPARHGVRERLDALRESGRATPAAGVVLRQLVLDSRHVCMDGDHDHDHDHDHHDHNH